MDNIAKSMDKALGLGKYRKKTSVKTNRTPASSGCAGAILIIAISSAAICASVVKLVIA